MSLFVSKHLHNWTDIIENFSIEYITTLLKDLDSTYWSRHFDFGRHLKKENKFLNESRVNLLVINVFIPLYLAIIKEESTGEFLEELMTIKPEVNNIVNQWKKNGVKITSLWDSQAILQLDKQYCSRNKCLSCRIGKSILKDGKVDYKNKKANGNPVLWGLSVVG